MAFAPHVETESAYKFRHKINNLMKVGEYQMALQKLKAHVHPDVPAAEKQSRARLSAKSLHYLYDYYQINPKPDQKERRGIADELIEDDENATCDKITRWFENYRAKEKARQPYRQEGEQWLATTAYAI